MSLEETLVLKDQLMSEDLYKIKEAVLKAAFYLIETDNAVSRYSIYESIMIRNVIRIF